MCRSLQAACVPVRPLVCSCWLYFVVSGRCKRTPHSVMHFWRQRRAVLTAAPAPLPSGQHTGRRRCCTATMIQLWAKMTRVGAWDVMQPSTTDMLLLSLLLLRCLLHGSGDEHPAGSQRGSWGAPTLPPSLKLRQCFRSGRTTSLHSLRPLQ